MRMRNFFRSFRFAFEGILLASKERNMRFHLVSAVIVVIAGLWTRLSALEWLVLIITIALVIGLEMVNTAIEYVVDMASPDFHPMAKAAKDVAAGAVLVFAIASVIIGLIIFLPKWI
ncbi:diacylglycerol kinase family protein [Ureibacillus sp. FSL K6-8385]|uniref:Diacylglycerol kinase family protein n=2 Tax=Caryophanaceae TaxID=186818 RepID=A0A540V6R6_9BACL|nr:diacylglycerol kinase family protein [Ureibacillus terrenus]MED3661528.1 diacylglycerol kinase family protein [Ureibacillus terrenus]MED3763996.1 diacylglycerol kinase family protein [Ureibacillus terrenus]TQE91873.1 diacylglycerol kinase family protein [Ureibacillus terrenus]